MDYPLILPDHSKSEWTHVDWFHDRLLENVKSYFHREPVMIGMHHHSFYELNILVEGCGRHYIEGQSFEAVPGCVFVIPPYIRHGYYSMPYLNIFHVLIHCAFIERYASELSNLPGYATLFEIEPVLRSESPQALFLRLDEETLNQLRPELEAMVAMEQSGYAGVETMKNGRLLWLIGALSEHTAHRQAATPAEKSGSLSIVSSMEYINRHFQERLTIDFLAHQASMSRSSYLRHFRQLCGRTPIQYLTGCRINHARQLLRCTDRSITDIAQECGFCDASHFIHAFGQQEGISPRSYRTAMLCP